MASAADDPDFLKLKWRIEAAFLAARKDIFFNALSPVRKNRQADLRRSEILLRHALRALPPDLAEILRGKIRPLTVLLYSALDGNPEGDLSAGIDWLARHVLGKIRRLGRTGSL